MRAGAHLGWRLAAGAAFGAAFGATAVLAVVASRTATPLRASLAANGSASPGLASHATARPGPARSCAAAGLRISVGPGARLTAAVTRYAVDFTNVSRTACAIGGYPAVAAYRGDDVTVGDPAASGASPGVGRLPRAGHPRVTRHPGAARP